MKFQREFLGLAKWYLACRLRVMGGDVENWNPGGGLEGSLLGMLDHAHEMRLLCAEVRKWKVTASGQQT